MIPAKKGRLFNAWFSRHARGRIQATFGRVLVAGRAEVRAELAGAPLLVVANHSAWWDALVALWLCELELGADAYALMDAKNLRRLPFFARVGAFGVDLDDPADGARSIRYAAKLLDRPGRVVWVFPEGRERSPFAPLELQPGAAQMARVARRAKVVAVAVRYVFGEGERPDLWIHIGAPEIAPQGVQEGVARQTEAIGAGLAAIDRALAAGDPSGFELVHATRPGLLARVAERLLAKMLPL